MASIKVLNISLVLLCIAVTVFICTYLAISSSDTALNDTKDSRDTFVNNSFTVGEDSVRERTEEFVDLLLNSTVDYVLQFMEPQRLTGLGLAREIMAKPYDVVKNFSWHNLARYYWAYKNLMNNGNSGVGIYLTNELMIFYYESMHTVQRGPNEYHHTVFVFNYGSDHPLGGRTMDIVASSDPETGVPLLLSDPATDVDWTGAPCNDTSLATNGTVPMEPCGPYVGNKRRASIERSFIRLGRRAVKDSAAMTPPISFGHHITVNTFAPIHHNGVYTGTIFVGADLRHISRILSDLKIGGPVAGSPSRGRIYITVRSKSWRSPVGMLIAATHGNVAYHRKPPMQSLTLMPPTNSSDPIVQSVAEEVEAKEMDLETMATLEVLNITTEHAPEGEEFYYRVGILNNGHGIDWYVHVVIDRAYILGDIDKEVAETRVAIDDAEQEVDNNLKKARTVLYVLVVVVAMVLTTASVVFVLKIIEPLLVLEREMAQVAVMNLEGVDRGRPLSALREVQLMQMSFLKMIDNLVEFRNYMPASVLLDDDDDDEEESVTTGANTEKRHSIVSSSLHDSEKIQQKQQALHETEAKAKKVTLLACNMRRFLDMDSCQATKLASYLSMALVHVNVTRGTPDSFSGDRLYASWNSVRGCFSHRTAAYTCSREIVKGASPMQVSIGVASGEVQCGNMGCEGMKKFTFVGSLASWVHIVERVARMQKADIAVDSVVHEEVQNASHTRPLLHLSFPKHSKNVLLVYEASGVREVKEEEWMYQLAEAEASDLHAQYTESYKLFMDQDVEGALKALEGYTDTSHVTRNYMEQLEKAAQNKELCQPWRTLDLLLA